MSEKTVLDKRDKYELREEKELTSKLEEELARRPDRVEMTLQELGPIYVGVKLQA